MARAPGTIASVWSSAIPVTGVFVWATPDAAAPISTARKATTDHMVFRARERHHPPMLPGVVAHHVRDGAESIEVERYIGACRRIRRQHPQDLIRQPFGRDLTWMDRRHEAEIG